MSLQEAVDRLVVAPRDPVAAKVLADGVHRVARILATEMRIDPAVGEQEAQELLVRVFTAASTDTLRVTHADAWVRRSLHNRLVSHVRRRKHEPLDPDVHERARTEGAPGSNPVVRLEAAYRQVLEARRPVDRPSLEEAWARYWRTVHESRTLESIVREEDPGANAASAQRAHDRLAKAVCAAADPDDRALFTNLLSLRVLSGGSGEPRPRDGDP